MDFEDRSILIGPIAVAVLPTVMFGMQLFIHHGLDKKPLNRMSAVLCSLIGASIVGSYVLYAYDRKEAQAKHTKNVQYEFAYKKCLIQMSLLFELLQSEDAAIFAIAGLMPTKIQYQKTMGLIAGNPGLFTGFLGFALLTRMRQIECCIGRWAEKNPERMQFFECQLEDECKAVAGEFNLSMLEV